MKKKYYYAFTLIEVLILLIVVGIAATALTIPLTTTVRAGSQLIDYSSATNLGDVRMNLILAQWRTQGYVSFNDPCSQASCNGANCSPAVCQTPEGYTVTGTITPYTFNTDAHYKMITVTVTGKGSSTLNMIVAEY